MVKNKKRRKEKEEEEERIKIVKSPAREFTFVDDIYSKQIHQDLDAKNRIDTRKLSDIRNRDAASSKHDFKYRSKGRNIQSKQGHSPVYE
jgi:hypothetical protein